MWGAGTAAGAGAGLLLLVVVVLGGASDDEENNACVTGGAPISADAAGLGGAQVGPYGPTQLANAAAIINAGRAMNLSARDQTIGVMTAIGESSLQVLDRGDAVGPDSRGLFQQRDNGAWGSYADRMDPTTSATNFFRKLATLEGRDAMEPTIVAHRVQRNANPHHYARYWDVAVQIVTALAGGQVEGIAVGAGTVPCTDTAPVTSPVTATGWTRPTTGPFTSAYGMRFHPIYRQWRLHAGVDFGGGCDRPILSAAAGVVARTYFTSTGGHTVVVDHGGGTTTRYLHMEAGDVLASVGQQVQAGTQIGRTGAAGTATACHLHFEVYQSAGGRDVSVDPRQFLADRGVAV
ncbi:M23 family metallopeptidase [uncultured Cellulomonas sp.]|uniref:M23 family metallopeptidase n=1 Tax=uncultured Cellulomonas sp. TaxID=189682 RepID=UPI002620E185|nr:M23 family metallopeptidase [uncultured Cellulomonas sp.]